MSAGTEALVERLFSSLLGGMELMSVELGRRLGLYHLLRETGAMTAGELAAAGGIAPRYAREWLEQQAVAGFVDVDDPDTDADTRRYRLPAEHAPVFCDEEHAAHLMGAAPSLRAVVVSVPEVARAYRTGDGVAFAHYGDDLREGLAGLNRPVFTGEMASWLDALPDVVGRGPARVLDVGCGTGWSTIALARALPDATVVGVDLDEASVREAARNAKATGLDDRVRFTHADAAGAAAGEPGYDLACVFEALHDMGDPVGALTRIREALTPGGVVLIADERVAESFVAPGDDIERFMYAWSVLHCLPATTAESPAVANGTVLRPSTLRAWARAAGYRSAQTLPIDNQFWRFYRLDP